MSFEIIERMRRIRRLTGSGGLTLQLCDSDECDSDEERTPWTLIDGDQNVLGSGATTLAAITNAEVRIVSQARKALAEFARQYRFSPPEPEP